jgi:hypothetical protein
MPIPATSLAPLIGATVVLLALLVRSGWRLICPRPSLLDGPLVFLPPVFLALLVLRWHWIMFPGELNNPDESQFVAQAMRFLSHPVPWRDVDTNTSGPLNSMFLSPALWVGAPASWATARIVLWLTICLILVFAWLALRTLLTPARAQFALMPAIFLYAFATSFELNAFSSETLPVLLLSAALCLLAREWRATGTSRTRLFLLGLICGSIPFAKLQAAPIAAFLAAAGLLAAWGKARRLNWRDAASLCGGGALVPFLILGIVTATGALGDFWKSYILFSASYVNAASGSRFGNMVLLLADSDFTRHFFDGKAAMAMLTAAWFLRRVSSRVAPLQPVAVVVAGFVVSVACVVLPGRPYVHYLYLLVPTLALFTGVALAAGSALLGSGESAGGVPRRVVIGWVSVFAALIVGSALEKAGVFWVDLDARGWQPAQPANSLVAMQVSAASRPGDAISIWGWAPAYYLQTGLPPATRDAISHYVISDGPYQGYFQQRYLDDLRKSRPPIFIDAIASGVFLWNWPLNRTHESFPALASFIDGNYSLYKTIPLITGGKPVRVYVSKQRLAELERSPAKAAQP